MNFIERAWQWLITKHEKEVTVSEALNDTDVSNDVAPAATSVTAVVSDGVHDFEAALQFVLDGVEKLGGEAKDELVALAKKYL